jgi:Fibronectin type III domain
MPDFPTKEADITALTYRMVFGYMSHPLDFPHANLFALSTGYTSYAGKRDAQVQAKAAVALATENKNRQLATLTGIMKNCLKTSEVDTTANPEKLTLIGWAPRPAPAAAEPPNTPMNFTAVSQGSKTVFLEWDSPVSGGPVRNYIIHRRQQPAGGGQFGEWEIVGTSLNNEINLLAQPRGVQMEYWVKAVNTGGESNFSNTAAIIL